MEMAIRYGAGVKTLTLAGVAYDLRACDRAQFNRLCRSVSSKFERPQSRRKKR